MDTQLLLEFLQSNEGSNSKVHILDLKHSDSRPDLVSLRNAGVQHFIVDIGADLLNIFFDQASYLLILYEFIKIDCKIARC